MGHFRTKLLASSVALVLAAGWGGVSTAASSHSGAAGDPTYTIGLLTDVTGPGASGNKTSIMGTKAGIVWAKSQGYNFKLDIGDDTTSPTGALTASTSLVQQDHVLAVIADSAVTFGGSAYLAKEGIPVVGVDQDASEWAAATNMFSVTGVLYSNLVTTTTGKAFKLLGATKVGTIGYAISPSSSESAKADAVSVVAAGLQAPYVNGAFPFGSTNVQPVALQMKAAGINGFTSLTDPNTAFALITALRQAGVNLKVALLADGYGGDLTQAGPGAAQVAKGVYFQLTYEPVELNTPATRRFVAALRSVGVTGDPTEAEYNSYAAVVMLVQGLKAAGANPTHASLLAGLSSIHSFDAAGLYGGHPININDRAQQVDNCYYVTVYTGTKFKLVPGAAPICGTIIPGKTVTASS
jgi:ABC-type branched-subunit amino acid transport system substrate-binding protein